MADEVGQAYTRAQTLCGEIGDVPQRFTVLWGLWTYHVMGHDLWFARDIAKQLVQRADACGEAEQLVVAYYALGTTDLWCGEFSAAQASLEKCIANRPSTWGAEENQHYGFDVGALGKMYLAIALWMRGKLVEARQQIEEGLQCVEEITHPYTKHTTIFMATLAFQACEDRARAVRLAHKVIEHAAETGFVMEKIFSAITAGWAEAIQNFEQGIELMLENKAAWYGLGASLGCTWFCQHFFEACLEQGDFDAWDAVWKETEMKCLRSHEQLFLADIYRQQGERFSHQAKLDPEHGASLLIQAESLFSKALMLAQAQGGKIFELRASTSLARLWHSQGRQNEACELISPILQEFHAVPPCRSMLEALAVANLLNIH